MANFLAQVTNGTRDQVAFFATSECMNVFDSLICISDGSTLVICIELFEHSKICRSLRKSLSEMPPWSARLSNLMLLKQGLRRNTTRILQRSNLNQALRSFSKPPDLVPLETSKQKCSLVSLANGNLIVNNKQHWKWTWKSHQDDEIDT